MRGPLIGAASTEPSGFNSVVNIVLPLLLVLVFGVLHLLIVHLRSILVPFVLGGFVVLTLQPAVDWTYNLFAGISGAKRWCCCCCRRSSLPKRVWSPPSSPASRSMSSSAAQEAVAVAGGEEDPWKIEEVDDAEAEDWCTYVAEGCLRFLAVSVILMSLLLLALTIFIGLANGAMAMHQSWGDYRAGIFRLEQLQTKLVNAISRVVRLPTSVEEKMRDLTVIDVILKKVQEYVWNVVESIVHGIHEGLSMTFVMMMYVLFWLLEPLPSGGKAGRLVRSYLYKKTFASAGYGICVALLFVALGIDLAILFGIVAFFLNFIPEIGCVIAILIPMPVIILDGRLDSPFVVLFWATLGQLVIKFMFANVLEVKLVERDREMSIHPVWVIFGLTYFGFVWGPVGMLISVPVMAIMKATSAEFARNGEKGYLATAARQFLSCLEGRQSLSSLWLTDSLRSAREVEETSLPIGKREMTGYGST